MNYLPLATKEEVRYWINHNLKNYLKKNPENVSEIEHIIDYLNSDAAPSRLKKMSYAEANEGAKRWVKTMVRRGSCLEDVEDVDYNVEIDFGDGFKLVRLKSKLAYEREGALMAHCVSSYFDTSSSNIYSLRDSKNMPHCTLELPEGATSLHQCKGKGNGPIHPRYIYYILETMRIKNIAIRSSEMSQLGYFYPSSSKYSRQQIEWFCKAFRAAPTLELRGKKYYYLGK